MKIAINRPTLHALGLLYVLAFSY